MIGSYPIDEKDYDAEANANYLNTLAYNYHLLKLFPYPKCQNISFSLNPKLIAKSKYIELIDDCHSFDAILAQMYNNIPNLIKFYKDYASGDDLVLIFLELYEELSREGFNRNKPTIYIKRHDFMYDKQLNEFIEVEYNLMAASAGFHAENARRVLQHYHTLFKSKDIDFVENPYKEFHLETFVKFWSYYCNPDAYIAIILTEGEWNLFETIQNQQHLLAAGIKTIRILVKDIFKEKFWRDDGNNLIYEGKEIGMVYYRYLYDSTHFINDTKAFVINAELSNALCLPSLETWLVNMKMNQYLLFSEKAKANYNISNIEVGAFEKHLCPHYTLKDTFFNDKARMLEFIRQNLDGLLLKSFKEGGFGEIYGGEDLLSFVMKNPIDILNRYLLVKKINAVAYPTSAFIEGKVRYFKESETELGIFTSAVLKIDENKTWNIDFQKGAAYLLRTKPAATIKGGIAVNASFVDVLAYQ